MLVWYQIDKWWPATLVGYSPRFLLAAPLILLFPMCLWKFRKGAVLLIAAGIMIAWPIMGLQVPLRGASPERSEGLKIISANMGGGCSTERLLALIERESPDLVVLQEYSARRNHKIFSDRGWHIESRGGLFCASRFPIVEAETIRLNPKASWEIRVARFEIAGPDGAIQLFDIHLPTVREGLQEVIDDKFDGLPELEENSRSRMRESQAVSQWVRSFAGPKVILGDFNMPADSAIYQECWSQFDNAFAARGFGYGFTKFTRYHGIRIDHILTDRSWEIIVCRVGTDIGGDHRPVLAELIQR
jgi:endonuclease/exonuclease/phosphatase (EEP) superfamily protein YafD